MLALNVRRILFTVAISCWCSISSAHTAEKSFENWRNLVAERTESAAHFYFLSYGGAVDLSYILRDHGLKPVTADAIVSDRARLTLQQGIAIAQLLQVEPWWLLGLRELRDEFSARYQKGGAVRPAETNLQDLQSRRFQRYREVVEVALRFNCPSRPENHVYEPKACSNWLTTCNSQEVIDSLEQKGWNFIRSIH